MTGKNGVFMFYAKEIPVRFKSDVFIIGGGPAGIAAALAARRNGGTVYLAEGHSCFGGMGTAGLVPAFSCFSNGKDFLAGGLGEEIFNCLKANYGTGPDSDSIIKAETFKRVYDELMLASGAEFTFETRFVDVIKEGETVTHAVLNSVNGLFAAQAKIFIDCTGNGDLAAMAGAPFVKGNANGKMMPGTLCSLWANVNWEKYKRAKPDVYNLLLKAFEDDIFKVKDRHHTGMHHVGNNFAVANMGHAFGVDGTDDLSMTQAWIEARKMLPEYEKFYRKYVLGFEETELAATGSLFGIRESRRIIGDYVLNVEDFKKQAVFEDEIGRFAYAVDIHPLTPEVEEFERFKSEYRSGLRYKQGESYGIPYRCLTPKKLKNVLTAGRCVSTDQYMEGSLRVMPGCFITGQAAGTAAAIAAAAGTDVRGFPVKQLQQQLKQMGGFLPNLKYS